MTEEAIEAEKISDRMNVTLLGKIIGTADGWDQISDYGLCFYDFKPADGVDLPRGDISLDFVEGWLQIDDATGLICQTTILMVMRENFHD